MRGLLHSEKDTYSMELILSNLKTQPILVLILAVIIALIVFTIVKKLLKVVAVLSLVLCIYAGYMVYKGKTITLSRQQIEQYKADRMNLLKDISPSQVRGFLEKADRIKNVLSE